MAKEGAKAVGEKIKGVNPLWWMGGSLALTFAFIFSQPNWWIDVDLSPTAVALSSAPPSEGDMFSDEEGTGGGGDVESQERGSAQDIFDILIRQGGQEIVVQSGDGGPTNVIKLWMERMGVTGEQNHRDVMGNSNLEISLVVAINGYIIEFEDLEDFNRYFRSTELEYGEGNLLFPEDIIILEFLEEENSQGSKE